MRVARWTVTVLLLLFAGATVGLSIAQEVNWKPTGGDEAGTPLPADVTVSTASTETSTWSEWEQETASPMTGEASDVRSGEPSTGSVAVPQAAALIPEVPSEAGGVPCVVDAIYFHNTHRCSTCQKIERDAKATIEAEFADRLAAGTLRWSSIDMEQERAYIGRYGLSKPTLILVRTRGNESEEWIALDETWTLVRSGARFSRYIEEGVRRFLDGCP